MPKGSADGEDIYEERSKLGTASKPTNEVSSAGNGAPALESTSTSGITRRLSVARSDPLDKVCSIVAKHV
jgi:hypothetical protein